MTEAVTFYCNNARPITYSQRDTAQTVREVRSHNAARKEICE